MGACCLAVFGWLFGGSGGGDWESSWVCVMVSGFLRVIVVCEGESFCGLGLGVIYVL